MNRQFKILTLFAIFTIGACAESAEFKVKPDTSILLSKTEIIKNPLNCPVMLMAYSGANRFEKEDWLSFSFKENPNFDIELQDDCKGDLKNIWPDLVRFEEEIKVHVPRIKSVFQITSYLEYFPQTEKDIRAYINKASIDALLYDELAQIDRSTLEGGMEFDLRVLQFIQANENEYWMREHAPVIERILFEYDLKMKNYDSEKSFYCYHLFDVCRKTHPNAPEVTREELGLEYMRPGFDWFSFQSSVDETIQ